MIKTNIKARIIGLKRAGLTNYQVYQRVKSDISMSSVYRLLNNIYNIEQENKDNKVFHKEIEKVKKDEIAILNSQISLIDENLTGQKAGKETFRGLITSKAILIDKRELLSGRATERIDVEGMTHIERIQFIRTGKMPDRMNERIKNLTGSISLS